MGEEAKLVTRSSSVLLSQLVEAVNPDRNTASLPAYQFSNCRTFEQSKTPTGEGQN